MSMINCKILLKRLIKNLNVSHDECEKSQYICKGMTDFHKNWHDNTDCVCEVHCNISHKHTHTHTRLTALFPGLPGWAGTRKVKPIWILLKQETVSGSGISWAICKSAARSRQPRQHPTTQFFTCRMPFLSPNQQHQSAEDISWLLSPCLYNAAVFDSEL